MESNADILLYLHLVMCSVRFKHRTTLLYAFVFSATRLQR